MKIFIVGMGAAKDEYMLPKAKEIIESAELIIGAKRLTDSIKQDGKKILNLISPKDIYDSAVNSGCENTAVLMTGDTGFYSGAKGLIKVIKENGGNAEIIPALSSVQLFAAKLQRPWQDWKLSSAHGVDINVCSVVDRNRESFFLTGGKWTVNEICRDLTKWGFGELKIHIGENLGSEKEKISQGNVNDFTETEISDLAVCLVENNCPNTHSAASIKDDDFIRGKIPMTKEEVRSVVISKMKICRDDIIYDVGAGTGSVSVEAALSAYEGHVYAVERESEGIELIKQNAEKHRAFNLTAVLGTAPEMLTDLPKPNVVFIGGSGGNMEEILDLVFEKNPKARIVITAVSLETLSEITELFKKFNIQNDEIVQISVSRAKLMGRYHLLMGQNPIFILSGNGI